MPDAPVSVSAAIAAELELHAADVFALMGNGNAWFLDAVVRRGAMTLTAVRHEAATIAAADAYHRASGRLAVASVTYGPGYTNAITPLAEAALARIPLVVVVGAERHHGDGVTHDRSPDPQRRSSPHGPALVHGRRLSMRSSDGPSRGPG